MPKSLRSFLKNNRNLSLFFNLGEKDEGFQDLVFVYFVWIIIVFLFLYLLEADIQTAIAETQTATTKTNDIKDRPAFQPGDQLYINCPNCEKSGWNLQLKKYPGNIGGSFGSVPHNGRVNVLDVKKVSNTWYYQVKTVGGYEGWVEEKFLNENFVPVQGRATASYRFVVAPTSNTKGNCHSSYPNVCIPPPPPDLDCKDISYRGFIVKPPDPHHFDGDNDGIGCES